MQDFIIGNCVKELSERKKVWLTKLLAAGYGVLAYAIVFLVKNLPGVLEAALGIFGIVGGPVLGAFTLGMFVPWVNSIGAFTGCFSSLIFTMWFGFGQTVARQYNKFSVPLKPLFVDGCSAVINASTAAARAEVKPDPCPDTQIIHQNGTVEIVEGDCFNHLKIYETSYMWFSAIPCLLCIAVGILVTIFTHLTKIQPYQDPKKLNPDLISPALPKLFCFWPKFIRKYFEPEEMELGSEYVMSEREKQLAKNQIGSAEDAQAPVANGVAQANGVAHKDNKGFELEPM